ncbi:hypothetical protein NPIL_288391 [Nephila pilipes]|uniref:Uncharacterized protein n=1 Tax=Nephila pilipes TaxID=299642 RepID=A0A8X6UF72_NEPPI|nr:hypothetical protein NPIL_288391 [Nephila pilipes]
MPHDIRAEIKNTNLSADVALSSFITNDKGEFQNKNDEEYIELERDNDNEIIPRRKRRTRHLSNSDSESSHEKSDE